MTGKALELSNRDFRNTAQFHSWLASANQEFSFEDIYLYLKEHASNDLGRARLFFVSYLADHRANGLEIARELLGAKDFAVRAYAQGYLSYQDLNANLPDFKRADCIKYRNAINLQLQEIRQFGEGHFVQEAEIMLRLVLAKTFHFEGEHQQAREQASYAAVVADQIGAKYCVSMCNSILVMIDVADGANTSVIQLIETEQVNPYRVLGGSYQNRLLAYAQFQMGNIEEAFNSIAMARDYLAINNIPIRENEVLLSYFETLFHSILGQKIGSAEHFTKYPGAFIIKLYNELISAISLPRDSKSSGEQTLHYTRVIELAEFNKRVETDWGQAHRVYCSAYAYYHQGHYVLALNHLNSISVSDTEWYFIRARLAALKLELALMPRLNANPEHLFDAHVELHKVFDTLNKASFSIEALVQQLVHWHPLAAAFMALHPKPIIHLKSAINAVLRVGKQNSIYNNSLRPVLASEFVLRALHFDLRKNIVFNQASGPQIAEQRRALMTQYHDVEFARSYISAINIIYGLMQMRHEGTARQISEIFGIVPEVNASYKMLPLLDEVERVTKDLLDGVLTSEEFASILVFTTLENVEHRV